MSKDKNTLSADQKAREKIERQLDKNFFVEAGAGSGKTTSLVARLAGLIEEGEARIENIAAVTFTRKAAAELRERFQIRLERDLNSPEVCEVRKKNIRLALMNLEKGFIGTIHSFCAKLLRERPVEAGVDPDFEEMEEDQNRVCAEEVWSEYVDSRGFSRDSFLPWLNEHGIEPRQLTAAFLNKTRYPEVSPVTDRIPRPDLSEEKRMVKKLVGIIRKAMPGEEPANGWDRIQNNISRAQKLIHAGFLENDKDFVTLLRVLDIARPGITKNRWDDPKTGEEMLGVYSTMLECAVRPGLLKWREYVHAPLTEFITGGVEYYQLWREERSVLNFQDLLLLTAKLLRENVEVRDYFSSQITHLLVDEFQDTDPIQAEIAMLIAAEQKKESRWWDLKPRPGSLFVVGDPKQSIYRFRRADIDIYNRVKEIFRNTGGEVLTLTANFRSLPGVGKCVNDIFKGVFPSSEDRYQAPFAPMVTTRVEQKVTSACVFENAIEKLPGSSRKAVLEEDARKVAAIIHSAITEGVVSFRNGPEVSHFSYKADPSSFMVLTKKKDALPCYARALEELGIPYEISGGENLGASEELRELYKVFKTLCDPGDPVALIAALRGVFFGISDEELYQFRVSGGKFSWRAEPETGPPNVVEALTILRQFAEIIERHLAITAVEIIIEKLGIVPFASSMSMGSTRTGNILKTLELLRADAVEETGDFSVLLARLGEYLSARPAEEMSLFPNRKNAVRVMNVHRAKGLEAPVVFLADPLGNPGDFEPDQHVARTESGPRGYFKISEQRNWTFIDIAVPPDWQKVSADEKAYEDAEKRRLEYVAMTRAKDILFVSTYRQTTRRNSWEIAYPVLDHSPKLAFEKRPSRREKLDLDLAQGEWEQAQKKLSDKVLMSCVPTWRYEKVSELAEESVDFTKGAGRGREWGDLVHRALEACGRSGKEHLLALAGNWLEDAARKSSELDMLIAQVDGILESDLWRRSEKALERYFEMPFALMEENSLISGVMDLIFRESDGWVIADYKTDDFKADPKRERAYQKQLELYARYWEQITGQRVKEKVLIKVR